MQTKLSNLSRTTKPRSYQPGDSTFPEKYGCWYVATPLFFPFVNCMQLTFLARRTTETFGTGKLKCLQQKKNKKKHPSSLLCDGIGWLTAWYAVDGNAESSELGSSFYRPISMSKFSRGNMPPRSIHEHKGILGPTPRQWV